MSEDVDLIKQLFRRTDRPMKATTRLRTRRIASQHFAADDGPELAKPGDTIGRYQVQQVLGSGGTAVVYLAHHRHLDRQVALKVPFGPHLEETMDAARACEELRHPHILGLIDVDPENDPPYLVMEYCSEGSLADRLDAEGALPEREVLNVARELLDALATAHEAGLVHRNLKPDNILFDALGRARIADLGLGAIAEERARRSLAAAGVPSSPLYLAPEQEKNSRADFRCDLFAFGRLLYAMLTGEKPRSLRPVERVKPTLDPGWNDVILRLTETHPERRFADAVAALAALDRLGHDRTELLDADPALGPSVHARLVVLDGEQAGDSFVLSGRRPTRIGRRSSNDIAFKDTTVSGVHAEIRYDGGFVLQDLDSANGTTLDGRSVVGASPSRRTLAPGAVLGFGSVRARFEPLSAGKPVTTRRRRPARPRRWPAWSAFVVLLAGGFGAVAQGLFRAPQQLLAWAGGGLLAVLAAVVVLGRLQRWSRAGRLVICLLLGGLASLCLSRHPSLAEAHAGLAQLAGCVLLGLGCLATCLDGLSLRADRDPPSSAFARAFAPGRHATHRLLRWLEQGLWALGLVALFAGWRALPLLSIGGMAGLLAAVLLVGMRRVGFVQVLGLFLALGGIVFALLPWASGLPLPAETLPRLSGLLLYAGTASALFWRLSRRRETTRVDPLGWLYTGLFVGILTLFGVPYISATVLF